MSLVNSDEPVAAPDEERVERMRRSIAMLAPRPWALRREEATEILAVLPVALHQLDDIERSVRRHPAGTPAPVVRVAQEGHRDVAYVIRVAWLR